MYKKYEHICPMCQGSLHKGEPVELHHIVPRKAGGKYSIENILPLHQICHQQVTHGNKSLERLKVALTPKEPTKRKRVPKGNGQSNVKGTMSKK